MKKTVYNDVSISYLANGDVASLAAEGEEAEALAAMAHAHQDIHWHGANDYIIPWSAVLGVTITKSIEDVSAPHDDICDGYCDKKGLNIELKDISSKCYTLDGANLASMSFVVGGETITVPALDGDVSGLIKAKTYDCEAVNAEIAYEMALSEGTATLTITATYNGETVTKAISTETECA